MKIWYVNPSSREFVGGAADIIESNVEKFAREGVEVTQC